MDFQTDKEHSLLMEMYGSFAETEVKPLAKEIDETETFPLETVKKMARFGMLGIPFPKEWGGAGGDNLAYAMAVEAMSKVCGTTGGILSAHLALRGANL
ncbi:hypothetical protein MASR2M48_32090 [Spirochaetota bacterium]